MARSQIGDISDMMIAFPQMTYNEYLYERSYAQIQFLSNDNTHMKYLKGKDKMIWEEYQKRLKAQRSFENFLTSGTIEEES